MAVIFYFSSLPNVPLPSGFSDKVSHLIAYFGFGVVVVRAFAGGLRRRFAWTVAVAAIVFCAAYGASDEFHQVFVPGRSADIRDLFADAIGGALATGVCWAWGIISPPSERPRGLSRHDL
jgi:VanZ family protein